MIERTITPRALNAQFPFFGDESKIWKCRIVDSNLGTDADPKVNFVRNGIIDLTFIPRHLNATLQVIYYEAHETQLAETREAQIVATGAMPAWMLALFAKLGGFSKTMAAGAMGLVALSMFFALLNYTFGISDFLDTWQKFNAANGSKVVETTVQKVIKHISTDTDEFYNSPGIKEIEAREDVKISDLFALAENGIYIMRGVFTDKSGEFLPLEYGDAEDCCESLGGALPTEQMQDDYIMNTMYMKIRMWAGTPEWTSTSAGTFSDDYVINQKNGDAPDNTYTRGGKLYGDDGDVVTAARCMIDSADFIEEKPQPEKSDVE